MKRRTFIIGAGSLSASGAAVLGTGAFSAAQISDRDVDIAVVNDASALVGLVPNPEVGGVHDNQGQLTIDLSDPGINQNSIYQFGLFVEDGDEVDDLDVFPLKTNEPSTVESETGTFDSAFLIANQTNTEYELTIEYELDETDSGNSDEFNTRFWFEAHKDGEQLLVIDGPTPDSDPEVEEITLGSGETIGVSFLLQAPDETLGETISGSLAVDAIVPN